MEEQTSQGRGSEWGELVQTILASSFAFYTSSIRAHCRGALRIKLCDLRRGKRAAMNNESDLSRRSFVRSSLAAPALVLPSPEEAKRRLRVLCVGAHPDDPESGCGGTLARYAALGHRVTIAYLTRGERGIAGKSLDEAAAIRTAEAEAACRILGATPVFAGQIDGATEVNGARVDAMAKLVADQAPDVVFAHWPVDTHLDHQVAGVLAYRAYLRSPRPFLLYFFEVMTGSQTMGFVPTDYVDIAAVHDRKLAALYAHKSQNPEEIYRDHHEIMEEFRGREAGMRLAEAFARVPRDNRIASLPEL
jgi:LmbE family N-acetylglucosaminyl deacetylase